MKTLVFIDDGFLSKLSKHFGKGEYIKLHRKDFAEKLCQKEGLDCEKIFVYTAPPFQSGKPNKSEIRKIKGYNKFKRAILEGGIILREGRCQRLKVDGIFVYKQKSVDVLMAMDLMDVVINYPTIKKIILIASDSDFVPIIKKLKEKNIKTILYTHFDKKRDTPFSRSNDLIKSVHKYVQLTKEDLENEQ